MRVFVYIDMDGHVGVYDVNTPEQEQIIFRKVVSDLGGDPDEIHGMDIHDIIDYLEKEFDFCAGSRGYRAQVLDVKSEINQFVEQ